ncbi:sensor histidine kinase [Paraflavitalea pollutisoli]|uniref:sensor histidine kinase n=1 Tax=Paraflavitalea pollutisoli TaxID=3034143 RepID=UPI0023EC507F|nr:sensor histidine kinase [Paraflavitalea sp. H1-2-19X]
MKYRLLLYSVLLLMAIAIDTQAQTTVRDSLAVVALIDRAESFFSASKYDSALYYCDLAETYSRRQGYRKGVGYAGIERADILLDKGDLEKASTQAGKTQALGLQLADPLLVAIAQLQQAQVKMYGGRYDEAIPLFEQCTREYFAKHPTRYGALAYNDFGYTYGMKGDLTNKAACLLRSVGIYESLGAGYDGEKAAAYNNLATLYYELKQSDKTIEYAKQSILYREKAGDIARLSLGCCNLSQFYLGVNAAEALRYQQLCVQYALQSGEEQRIVHAYVTASLIASDQQDTAAALEYELKAIALLERSGRDPMMLSRRYIAAGMAYSRTDPAKALHYYDQARQLALSRKDKFNLRDCYYQLALFYKGRAQFDSAYTHFNQYVGYRDSIIKDRTTADIAELGTKYETEKKDNLITRLHAEQRIKALQLEKQQALLAGNLAEAGRRQQEIDLLSKEKELQTLRIHRQQEQLERQQLLASNAQQQLALADKEKQLQERQLKGSRATRNFLLALLAVTGIAAYFLFNRYQLKRQLREQEALLSVRNHIAQDLHDEIGSTLTSIKILSEASGKSLQQDSGRALAFIRTISEQSAAAQQGISDIVWAVKPENDKLENMVIRMREYAAQTLESRQVRTEIHLDEGLLHTALDMQQRRDLLLIYKEAINNIAKYARATTVSVKLEQQGHYLHLQIRDDGVGFDPALPRSTSGLLNMQQRARAMQGVLVMETAPGKGTVIDLQLPLT